MQAGVKSAKQLSLAWALAKEMAPSIPPLSRQVVQVGTVVQGPWGQRCQRARAHGFKIAMIHVALVHLLICKGTKVVSDADAVYTCADLRTCS